MRIKRRIKNFAAIFAAVFFAFPGVSSAEMKVIEGKNYIMEASPDFRTDFIMQENNNDLNTKIRDDRVQYIAIDYSLPFDLKFKEGGPEFFVQFQRNGVYDYDAPVVINNTLNTYLGKFYGYHGSELLPKVKEYWADIPVVPEKDIRFKAGLFKYEVGHGISLNGSYQNYSLDLYSNNENFSWNFYTCWPDFANKQLLGPYIKQEKPQAVDYEHSKTYFLATDMTVSLEHFSVQPYVGILMDFSEGKRLNYFQTPTRDDILGTVGISWDFTFDKLEISAEWARNFGQANASQEGLDNVVHQGYAVYADASYTIGTFVPRSHFVFASGNKLTTDMITNGDTLYPGTKNNAFSVYSPFNGYLADSIYPGTTVGPLVAMGNGYGLNYGVRRPGTFGDPAQIENLVLFSVGFEHKFIEKAVLSFDWWYLANAEKGIGMYNNVPKVISPELGNEVDLSFEYTATKNVTLRIGSGIFFPGPAFREERDDVNGSLFTPFVRGDGKADPAYQLELSAEISF
jgi:hypothetical protein